MCPDPDPLRSVPPASAGGRELAAESTPLAHASGTDLRTLRILVVAFLLMLTACGETPTDGTVSNKPDTENASPRLKDLRADIKKIEPFFKPMGEPGPSDWLRAFTEPGETFDQYIDSKPTLPTKERGVIYIQPIGNFTAQESRIIKTTSEYIEAFYGLPVKSLPAKPPPGKLTEPDERMIDYPKHRQIRTGYILDKILTPALPKDAAALIAFTNEDLYPGGTMYFVFGQASLENRVGVWSLYRLQPKSISRAAWSVPPALAGGRVQAAEITPLAHASGTDMAGDYELFLERTMKIAVHEVGHMFSMRHCTKYECVMSGTNHLGETDRRPIDACPECMAKIAWMTKTSPKDRYERMIKFAAKYKLTAAEKDLTAKSKAVSGQNHLR